MLAIYNEQHKYLLTEREANCSEIIDCYLCDNMRLLQKYTAAIQMSVVTVILGCLCKCLELSAWKEWQ